MKAVVVGCGRVGAVVSETLERAGYDVIVIDMVVSAFDRLPAEFQGNAIRGDGTDEDVLRRAGAENADIFLAFTEGDNRNVMAAQVASEALGAKQVVAKINDPLRAEAYADLGIATLCRTNLMEDAIHDFIGVPRQHPAGVVAPTGSHPGGEHHGTPSGSGGDAATAPLTGALEA